MNRVMKGHTIIMDDPVREIEDPDAHRKAVLKWYEATEALLSDVAVLPAASNKENRTADEVRMLLRAKYRELPNENPD